jgi:hypothetical protein
VNGATPIHPEAIALELDLPPARDHPARRDVHVIGIDTHSDAFLRNWFEAISARLALTLPDSDFVSVNSAGLGVCVDLRSSL